MDYAATSYNACMTSFASSFDVCIHGAGFVGRTLALLLAGQGMRVALLADAVTDAAAKDIRAFSLNSASKNLLTRIQAWPARAAVTPVSCMKVFGDAGGELVFNSKLDGNSAQALNWIVDVPVLEGALKEQVAGEPRIQSFASNAKLQAKLHVLCDARALQAPSGVSAQLGISHETIRYPQHALAARLVCEEGHDSAARQWFSAAGDVLALLPMNEHAGHQVALVWSLESEHAKTMLACPDLEFLTSLEAACGKSLGRVRLVSERTLWPLKLTKVRPWTGAHASLGAWVLAGDAAHTMHPLAGQGLNVGLGDAALLAQMLESIRGAAPFFAPSHTALMRALRGYARKRQAAFAPIAGVTDGLHWLFSHPYQVVVCVRNFGLSWLNRTRGIKQILTHQAQ